MRGPDRFAALLRSTLVQVVTRDGYGSGVLVAPGHVLTCAHVVRTGAGTPLTVRWGERDHPAVVRYASPAGTGGLWAYPDIAVVELEQPPEDHPCAWLDQRRPGLDHRLLALGYSDVYQRGKPAPHSTVVGFDGTRPDGDGELLQLAEREISSGMSGGPVLSLATGGVCGLVKATRLPNAPMGGLATPIRALRAIDPELYRRLMRAHDHHHAVPGAHWAAAVDELAATEDELEPAEERTLRALLAELPPADDHAARLLRAGGPLLAPRPGDLLVDHGDVVTDLGELVPPRSGLPYVLTYAIDLARDHDGGRTGRALRDWVMLTAGRLRLGASATARLDEPTPDPAPTSVMVRVRPAGNDRRRYRLTVWRWADPLNVVPALDDQEPAGAEETWRRLRELLPEQLRLLEGPRSRVRVELFLPRDLLDADVDRWQLWPEAHWSTLGRRYPVLVRDVTRLDDDRGRYASERRWDKLNGQCVDQMLEFIDCTETRGHEELEGWIEPEEARSALVFGSSPVTGSPRPVLEVGLPAGVPVMIWRRTVCSGCTDPTGDGCAGRRFFADLRAALADTLLTDLPEQVRKLRNDAVGSGNEEHCGHGIVLLCDDPRRRPPLDRMVLPEERRDHD